jgi:predicted ABC-type ATPase
MWYVGLDTVERHVERVKRRAARMGHSASERTLRRIHASSLGNLPLALNPDKSGIEIVRVYDNSHFERRPNLALESRLGMALPRNCNRGWEARQLLASDASRCQRQESDTALPFSHAAFGFMRRARENLPVGQRL